MAGTQVLKDCQKKFDALKAACTTMRADVKDKDREAGKSLRLFNGLMRELTARIQQLKNEGHDYDSVKNYMGDKEVRQLHMIAADHIRSMTGGGLSAGSKKKLDAVVKDYKQLKQEVATAIKEQKGKATKRVDGTRKDGGEKLLPELEKLQRELDGFDRHKEGLKGLGDTDGDHDGVDVADFNGGLKKAIARIKAAPNKDGKSFKDLGWDRDKIAGRVKQMDKYHVYLRKLVTLIERDRKLPDHKRMDGEERGKLIADGKKALNPADKLAQQYKKLVSDKELAKKLNDDKDNSPVYKDVLAMLSRHKEVKQDFEDIAGASKDAKADEAAGQGKPVGR